MLHRKTLFSAATVIAVMTAAPLALAQSSSIVPRQRARNERNRRNSG